MSRYLQQKISAVRSRHVAVATATGLAAALALGVAILTLSCIADWYLDLDRNWRAVTLAAAICAGIYALVRFAALPIVRTGDDESLALAVERIAPAFSTRLIAAIQFARHGTVTAGESAVLVRAMVQQTEEIARTVHFGAVVRLDRLARWSAAALVILIASSALYAGGGDNSRVLLQRAFLQSLPLPQKTHVEVVRGSFLVATGESAPLAARARGVQPDAGTAELTFASGRTLTLTLKRTPDDPSLYAGTLDAVRESFTYRVRLNDGTSESFSVTAEDRPVVQSLVCTQMYPAYTGIAATRRQPTDLLLLAGSKLHVDIHTNKPLAPNATGDAPINLIRRHAQKDTAEISPVALSPDSADPRHFTADLDLPENIAGMSIHLRDAAGLESKDPPVYPIDLLPDRPPAVRITAPDRREILVTQEATTPIGFVAEDDFGLAAVSLHYSINDGPDQVIPLAINAGDLQVKGYYPWSVGKLSPPGDHPSLEGCVVEFYIEARDGNTVTGPGITASEHYQLRVVSKSDKQAELIARMAESFSTLHGVTDSQENAAAELGAIITEQSAPATQRNP